jgi:hypothetical protein
MIKYKSLENKKLELEIELSRYQEKYDFLDTEMQELKDELE